MVFKNLHETINYAQKPVFLKLCYARNPIGFRGDHSRVTQNLRACLRKKITLKKQTTDIFTY